MRWRSSVGFWVDLVTVRLDVDDTILHGVLMLLMLLYDGALGC